MAVNTPLTAGRIAESPSQTINRREVVKFTFNGNQYTAYEGDTIASALAAAGVDVFSRSFKYHRPRGLMCTTGNCPNCLVQIGDEPNVRACVTPVESKMKVEPQNVFPALGADLMSATQMIGRFLPAGFYYKTFIHPRQMWPLYERVLRAAAGLGKVDEDSHPGYFDKIYKHADVTVVGGGPAGLKAAQTAAKLGARVLLMDEQPALGGHLRHSVEPINGQPAYEYAAALAAEISQFANVDVMTNTGAFGRYDHNWLGAATGNRLVKVRTGALVVATGAYETPPLFENNDLPGVMLGSAAARLIHLWGVRPGMYAVVVSANRRGLQTALDMVKAGVHLSALAEMRTEANSAPDADLIEQLRAQHVEIFSGWTAAEAQSSSSSSRINGVTLRSLTSDATRNFYCDLLVLSTAFLPANGLIYQAGGKFTWSDMLNEFVPTALPDGVFAAGEVSATHTLAEIEREGELAGLRAALAAGFGSEQDRQHADTLAAEVEQHRATRQAWSAYGEIQADAKKDFVCFCEDVTRKDVRSTLEEGYDSMELLKRYSTVSMGPCQGKMCNMNAMHVCAHYTGKGIAETGTTTSRPPVTPLSIGALGGRMMEPVRYTPMHEWHVARRAKVMNAGLWKRPLHYGNPAEEVRAVRERVGMIDVSTLGKLHLHGKDVPALLERMYTNRWQKLNVGQVRYGVMVNEEGIITDDGVTARVSDDLYYMTTTSEGASAVYEYIEWWLQSGWNFDVHVLNATDMRAAMNLAGPQSRKVLQKITQGVDLSNEAFPYMAAREGTIAGVPALFMRIGFTGELSYEVHVPGGYGLRVWEALIEAGAEFGISPFGVEAQRVLRLEKGHIIVGQDTDGLTNPFEANMDWVVKLDKDNFLGKPSLVMSNQAGAQNLLVGFEMPDGTLPEEANQIVRPGSGPIGLEIIGRVTSVRRSPTLNKVIGLCWLPASMSAPGTTFTVRVKGELRTGKVVDLPFYDADGARLRS